MTLHPSYMRHVRWRSESSFWTIKLPQLRGGLLANPLLVGLHSPRNHHNAVYALAVFFNREMHCDFVQYDNPKYHQIQPYGVPNCEAYLFHVQSYRDSEQTCVGAACFRLLKWTDLGERWTLTWVWFHPYTRRTGLLSGAWPGFLERYGNNFLARPPFTIEMPAFMRKHGTPEQLHDHFMAKGGENGGN